LYGRRISRKLDYRKKSPQRSIGFFQSSPKKKLDRRNG